MLKNNNHKYECNTDKICCKMQKDSLRTAISGLKRGDILAGNAILNILAEIKNILVVYDCPPGNCLSARVEWAYNHIRQGTCCISTGEELRLKMLIAELEAFLNN